MLLNKLKVTSLVCFVLALGGVSVGIGVTRLRAEQPAAADPPARTSESNRSAASDPEPIDGALLLNQQIQAELQLSKNQVRKLEAVSRDVDAKNDAKHKEIEQVQKRIEELRQEIARLQKRVDDEFNGIGKIRDDIEGERKQALGKAAPEILSARAIKRLREIQRQKRGLRALLQDPKVQQMLKVDDEQVRKIEGILKKEAGKPLVFYDVVGGSVWADVAGDYDLDGWPDIYIEGQRDTWESIIDPRWRVARRHGEVYWNLGDGTFTTFHRSARFNSTTNRQLMQVLTEAQQRALLEWVGEPYHSPSWRELWNKFAKKKS